jgi:hypothetical protein
MPVPILAKFNRVERSPFQYGRARVAAANLCKDPWFFAKVRAEGGTVVWPNGADLCPDV